MAKWRKNASNISPSLNPMIQQYIYHLNRELEDFSLLSSIENSDKNYLKKTENDTNKGKSMGNNCDSQYPNTTTLYPNAF